MCLIDKSDEPDDDPEGCNDNVVITFYRCLHYIVILYYLLPVSLLGMGTQVRK